MEVEKYMWKSLCGRKQPLACVLITVLYTAALVCALALKQPSMPHFTTSTKNTSGLVHAKVVHNITTFRKQVPVKKKSVVLQNLSSCFKTSSSICLKTSAISGACLQNIVLKSSFQCQHLMNMAPIPGRTGNQLFVVAALLATATRHGYTAVIDSSLPLTTWFNLPNLSNLQFYYKSVKTMTLNACCKFDKRVKTLSHATNWTLHGLFQSWRFFEGAEDIVRNAFKIKDKFSKAVRKFISANVPAGTQTVCIHVRRGDFIKYMEIGLSVAPVQYIKNAVEYFRNRYTNVHFFVISTDTKWCKNNLRWHNVTIITNGTVGHDMAMMIESDHVIVTSGSFGWWGAWLSGGDVVYWLGYPARGTYIGNQSDLSDYYPSHWVGMW